MVFTWTTHSSEAVERVWSQPGFFLFFSFFLVFNEFAAGLGHRVPVSQFDRREAAPIV